MRIFFKIVSGIFHPLLIPFFGMILLFQLSAFSELPLAYRLYIEGLVLLNMGFIPGFGVWLLKKSGHVSDYDVSVRSERFFPYMISLISYLSACYLLYKYQMPWWIIKLFLGSILATIVAFFITLKWKVSAHTMAFGCLIAAAFIVSFQGAQQLILLSIMLLLAGLQASSRLYLKAHTLGQVLVGFVLGVCSVCVAFFLIP